MQKISVYPKATFNIYRDENGARINLEEEQNYLVDDKVMFYKDGRLRIA